MNAAKLAANPTVRMLVHGYPGAGKTGSLASLANAGFKLRILDMDGNPESLLKFTHPDCLQNIDIAALEDKIVDKGDHLGPDGMPTAFTNAIRLLKEWRYKDPDGAEVDKSGARWTNLGKSSEWGTDTIVVLDGLTGLGEAAMNRARFIMGKTPKNMSQPVWGLAIQEQLNFIKALTAASNPHHVIVLSHVKIVGPKTEQSNDTELQKEAKQEAAAMIPTKLHPTALGWDLPQKIAAEFPITIHIGMEVKGKTIKRRFTFQPRADMDLKLPVSTIVELDDLTIRNGMLRIFKALGANPPQ